MSRIVRSIGFWVVALVGASGVCLAQYGGTQQVRYHPIPVDQVRGAVRTLLFQVDHLVDDMEADLVREPGSERLLMTAQEVRNEVEHLASAVERGFDPGHIIHDFQEFDAEWHRLTRQAARFGAEDRHLQRNLARISQTDADLHRILRVPTPVNMQEVRVLTVSLQRDSRHLLEDLESDLHGHRCQREVMQHTAELVEATEHLEGSVVRGMEVRHIREDFELVDRSWLNLAGAIRELPPLRMDHVMRATSSIASTEGQLRAALGLEPNPDQFTCFRPAPSEARRALPYATNGPAVVFPSGGRISPGPGLEFRPPPPPVGVRLPPVTNTPDTGLSLMLGFVFGGEPREAKQDRPRPTRPDGDRNDDDDDRSPPPIRRAVPTEARPVTVVAAPGLPPKPLSPDMQARVEKNLAKLSPEDRSAAATQRICPVNGDVLGVHGVPIKTRIKDSSGRRREVFVCDDECEDELDDHPEKYRDRFGK
jgi:hypothetical protein